MRKRYLTGIQICYFADPQLLPVLNRQIRLVNAVPGKHFELSSLNQLLRIFRQQKLAFNLHCHAARSLLFIRSAYIFILLIIIGSCHTQVNRKSEKLWVYDVAAA
ncbi:hypothetical protein D3C74_396700 [compost metagenome]